MKIASGQEEAFREGIRSYIEATNAAPGCLRQVLQINYLKIKKKTS